MPNPRRLIALTVLLFAAAAALAAPATRASTQQAQQRLFELISTLKQKYPTLRDRTEYGIGTLEAGQTAIYQERFRSDTTYLVVAVGCDTAEDIDVGIVDYKGRVMAADTDRDAAAAVVFEPPADGDYVVGVNMAQTVSGDAAHFAYQVFYVDTER